MADEPGSDIETRLSERDRVPPPASFVEQANVTDPGIYETFAEEGPDAWTRAADLLDWDRDYDTVLDGEEPPFRWFDGGRLNACYNCVDRHLDGRKNQAALRWEGKLGESRTYTYQDLYREVNECAAALRDLGVERGDVVTLYMPMLPELPVVMLACARIGAVHNVVFAGFSADALATRMGSAGSAYLVTCDGYYRRGSAVDLKRRADNAVLSVDHEVEEVVVVNRLDGASYLGENYHDYDDLLAAHAGSEVEPVVLDANDLLFLIYTSGTTGKPKEVRHTTGGYLAHVAWTSHAVLDLTPEDVYWCSADIGWITGHSYIVYGPLALGCTTLLSEGTPDHPEKDRVWEIIERNAVDVFYTAPTAIRAFMKWGAEYPDRHDLSSLRLLGTVGEPINPRAWRWYHEHIGGGDCPIVDTWWQTETGGMMVSTLPGVDDMKPGAAGKALPGVAVSVVDADGTPVEAGRAGYLVVDEPWPGMPTALLDGERWGAPDAGDHWTYHTEDGATRDRDGYVTVLGRVDDVITIGEHRFGTMELESAIVEVDGVAEAAVVAGDDGRGGTLVYAYISPEDGVAGSDALREQVEEAIERVVGPMARPDRVVFTPELPKTRSGKIVRRFLTAITNDEDLGDTSALRNPEVVGELESRVGDEE